MYSSFPLNFDLKVSKRCFFYLKRIIVECTWVVADASSSLVQTGPSVKKHPVDVFSEGARWRAGSLRCCVVPPQAGCGLEIDQ